MDTEKVSVRRISFGVYRRVSPDETTNDAIQDIAGQHLETYYKQSGRVCTDFGLSFDSKSRSISHRERNSRVYIPTAYTIPSITYRT